MTWTVEFFDEHVLDDFSNLPPDLRAAFRRIVDLVRSRGLERVNEPYIKHLEGRIWKMRMKGKDGIARAAYVTAHSRRVVVVPSSAKKRKRHRGETSKSH